MTSGRRDIRTFRPSQKSINTTKAAQRKQRTQVHQRQVTCQYRISDSGKPSNISNSHQAQNSESEEQRRLCEIGFDARKNKSQQSHEERSEKQQNANEVIYSGWLPFHDELS